MASRPALYLPGHFEPEAAPAAGPSSYSMRRPWSPLDYDQDIADSRGVRQYFSHGRNDRALRGSEDSVEALDLADYARTLRRPTADPNSSYPPFPHTSHVHPLSVPTPVHPGPSPAYPEYPPSPDTDRPFSALSRDTWAHAPPSLVSGATSHDSHDSYRGRSYTLPQFLTEMPQNRGPAIFSPSADVLPHRITSPVLEEEDISRFPAFSRGWYDDPIKQSNKPRHTSLPPYFSDRDYDLGSSYRPFPSAASSQARSILPWGSQLSDTNGPPVDSSTKEERMRMLQHEFGSQGRGGVGGGEPMIGSVDEKGAMITVGPKRRAGARWAQGILALGAAFSSLYGALFIKLSTPAPPSSRPPAFALYGLSVITFGLVFYLFAIRPCCCGKRPKPEGSTGLTADGMMVLPVQGLPGGKKKNRKKDKKAQRGGERGGDVQVNLIVDPSMFGRGQDETHNSEDEYDSQISAPRRQRRRGIFQGLQVEREWGEARKRLKRMLFVDLVCLAAWTAVFVLILFGKKCPPGAFSGWCDSYNIATAAACLLTIAYGFSVYFDIVDLHMSKASPRTRT